jgi:DNA polymerase
LLETVTSDVTCRANVRAGKKVVLGVGSLEAKIMFVGEAPGAEEEIQGEPFVGPAGQLLTKMIQAMGLKRSDVYIGNIMNWRPQMPTVEGRDQVGNRPPSEEEMRYCLPYLRAQIEVVNPELLVALGSTAAQGLLGFGSFKALGDIRGQWREFAGKPLMVTYHPSYILRNQSNRSKRMIWEDLLKVMERATLPISEKQRDSSWTNETLNCWFTLAGVLALLTGGTVAAESVFATRARARNSRPSLTSRPGRGAGGWGS